MRRIMLALLVLAAGCKGKDGAVGPTGPSGSPGDAIPTLQVVLRSGALPDAGYTAVLNNVDRANADTSYSEGATIRLANTVADHPKRILARFPLQGYVPQNAVITQAALQLASVATTSINAAVTIGVFDLGQDVMDTCIWSTLATWNRYNGTIIWGACGTPLTVFSRGVHYPTDPMDAVVIPSTATGTNMLFAWNLSVPMVQKWLNSPTLNNGVVITSTNEWAETATGDVVFGNNAAALNLRPTLVVNYYIP